MSFLEESIDTNIKKVQSLGLFGKRFVFRDGQREIIKQILSTYIKGEKKTIILDAPTGSGKSIMAMFASLMLVGMGKKGYIITSDLELQKQYQKDFANFGLNWGNIKGKDNYTCHVDNSPFGKAPCQSVKMTHAQAKSLKCYDGCGYYKARALARTSNITLMNYAYWLLQTNHVFAKLKKYAPFGIRDFVFFDEAHKIDTIVQDQFCVSYPKNIQKIAEGARGFAISEGISCAESLMKPVDFLEMYEYAIKLDSTEKLKIILNRLCGGLSMYDTVRESLMGNARKKFGSCDGGADKIKCPAEWGHAFRQFDKLNDISQKVGSYIEDIRNEHENIVKVARPDGVVFKNLNESVLIKKRVADNAPFRVFMSATIGDMRRFENIMGTGGALKIRMPNTFDYSKSKIYQMGNIRLSYKHKKKNMPIAISIADAIIGKSHENQRGVVHTVSYEITQSLLEKSRHKDRFITYNGAAEKSLALDKLSHTKNGILVGPSITEGVDLPDGLCRFQLLMKVPYPSLGDPFIKAKLALGDGWYKWKTVNSLLQAIGRSNRHADDWSTVYLIDGCFNDIIWTEPLPGHISERIVNVNIDI